MNFPRLRFRRYTSSGPGPTYTRPRLAVSDSDGSFGIKGWLSDNSDGDETILQLENTRFLIVEEQDGLPVAVDVRRIKVSPGTLTNLGGGVVSLVTSDADTSFLRSGTGSPEGVVVAGVGSLFLRTDGGAGTTLYVKESGAGNTGWVAK